MQSNVNVCLLSCSNPFARVDLLFTPLEEVSFSCKGNGAAIHLAGYRQDLAMDEPPFSDEEDMDDLYGDEDDEDGDDDDEDDAEEDDEEDDDDDEDDGSDDAEPPAPVRKAQPTPSSAAKTPSAVCP